MIEAPPIFQGTNDVSTWIALSNWLSGLHASIGSSFSPRFYGTTKSAVATLRKDEQGVIFVNSSGGAFTLTLPPANQMGLGSWFWFVKTDVSVNAITLDGNGAETINGALTNVQLDAQYDFMIIICDGSNWFIANIRSTM